MAVFLGNDMVEAVGSVAADACFMAAHRRRAASNRAAQRKPFLLYAIFLFFPASGQFLANFRASVLFYAVCRFGGMDSEALTEKEAKGEAVFGRLSNFFTM